MTKKIKVPYEFRNERESGKHVLTLSGVIAKNYWSSDKYIDAKMIREALDDVTIPIVIRLNSGGGDAYQGIEIYNYLKNHASKITLEVTGWVASAASIIAMGADEVVMNVGTTMLIHNASLGVWGNKEELTKALNMLDTLDTSIIDVYEERTGQNREKITEWMKNEKNFTAKECVEFGFADSVKQKKVEDDPVDIENLINSKIAAALTAQAQAVPNPEPPKQKSLLNKLRKGEIK